MIHGCDWTCEKKQDGCFFFGSSPHECPPILLGEILWFSWEYLNLFNQWFSHEDHGAFNKSRKNCLGVSNIFYFPFHNGMSSFPLTDIFSRWLKPPTSKPIDSIDRISVKDFRFSIALTRCKRSYPWSSVDSMHLCRRSEGRWARNMGHWHGHEPWKTWWFHWDLTMKKNMAMFFFLGMAMPFWREKMIDHALFSR